MPKMLYYYGNLPQNMPKLAKSPKLTKPQPSPPSNIPPLDASLLLNTSKTPELTTRPKTVAIVGSRHSTRYGEEIAYQLGFALAKRGVVVVSGLAFGIDSVGHQAALDAGGITIAVLGTPIDKIYPTAHTGLARQIIESGGAIISEYAPRTEKYSNAPMAPGEYYDKETGARLVEPKTSFLHRNRIISGLSDITVVIEAAERSGSLSTAAHALNQGREVFAVPGHITNFYSQGCNRLIQQGANVYTGPDDILRLLFPEDYVKKRRKKSAIRGDTPEETVILGALTDGARSTDEIIAASGLSADVFNQTMTFLEIKSKVKSLGMAKWMLM
ncbi:DNA-processing protein DprA [Candidatus Saccharibacteria bacterium]|nr:DNA-processing protein DprA [Candidatus Saccharibacteria bacterium]